MCRQLALETEVLGGPHQPGAKVVLLDAIDDHPRRERILYTHKPARNVEAARDRADLVVDLSAWAPPRTPPA